LLFRYLTLKLPARTKKASNYNEKNQKAKKPFFFKIKGLERKENGYWGKLKNLVIITRRKEIVCFGLQIFNKKNRLSKPMKTH
jgi:hypothetical protein